jgi:heptaprenyl diphosphate synthase
VKPGELKRQVQLAMLTAVALVLHIIESLLPPLPVPGAKIGLANVSTLISLRHMGFWSGVTVSAVRSILGSMISGKFWGLGFWMSFVGATISAVAMGISLCLFSQDTSLVWTSVIGGVVHASCQLIIAVAAMRQPALFAGAPLLLGLSIVTAVSIGIVCDNLDAPAKRLMQANKRR